MDLIVVARDRPMLYEAFRRMSTGNLDVEIYVDRRHRESQASSGAERRRLDIGAALRTTGWKLVPAETRRPARSTDTAA